MENIVGMIIVIMMVFFFHYYFSIGNWDKDRMNGRGLYVSPDGVAAEGTFENDNFIGPWNIYIIYFLINKKIHIILNGSVRKK